MYFKHLGLNSGKHRNMGLAVCVWIISSLFNKAFKPVVIFDYDALLLATMGMKHMLKIKCFAEWDGITQVLKVKHTFSCFAELEP